MQFKWTNISSISKNVWDYKYKLKKKSTMNQ